MYSWYSFGTYARYECQCFSPGFNLKHFQARHGIPQFVISDNGKTFKDSILRLYTVKNGTLWKFITERAPWFGGFYERLVQSVKRCLQKTLGNPKLTYEELNTHLIEVERVLNLWPSHIFMMKEGNR